MGVICLSLSFSGFLARAVQVPALALVSLLLLSVLLVNGWTDAPNAIATAVASGALPFRRAVLLAAGCNLAGSLLAASCLPTVAETVCAAADFGGDPAFACAALCAALAAVSLWAALAWRFGIPTSESHALLAGLAGAALALPGGWSNLRPGPWGRVLLGLALSLLLGWTLGRQAARALRVRRPSPVFCRRGQILGAAALAFLHGAQDGQKFLGVFLLGTALSQGRWDPETFVVPLWLVLLCACCMALGTLMGGKRLIDKIGRELVTLSLLPPLPPIWGARARSFSVPFGDSPSPLPTPRPPLSWGPGPPMADAPIVPRPGPSCSPGCSPFQGAACSVPSFLVRLLAP